MTAALAAIAFLPGLALGSFLNVVAARVPLRRSVVHPGSACMACETPLAWYDNIPIVSWALLRGRCRHCGTSIPWKYPLVELVTALLIGACVLAFGLTGEAAVASLFCAALVAISVTDLERNVIPNRIVLPAAAIVLARADGAPPVAGVGARRLRRGALPLRSRRLRIRPAWGWVTSSSPCCSARCSAGPCRWR